MAVAFDWPGKLEIDIVVVQKLFVLAVRAVTAQHHVPTVGRTS